MNTKREPYVFQIGFDFGTAYSKCIIRDLNTDDAFVYIPKFAIDEDMPFLFPSAIKFKDGYFSIPLSMNDLYQHDERTLHYLKLALEGIVNGRHKDILDKFDLISKEINIDRDYFIFASTVYFISKSIFNIKKYIKNKYPNYGDKSHDMIAINMCIPVYCANEINIKEKFSQALFISWDVSDRLKDADKINFQYLYSLIEKAETLCSNSQEYCFVYPEVSANMHGFIRSRASKPGTYLFSDTGAGTVDQCIFIFDKTDGIDKVAYISAEVFPLGSSMIERKSLEKFYSLPMSRQEFILSNLHKLVLEIAPSISKEHKENILRIFKFLSENKEVASNEFQTKNILFYIIQVIKENKDLFRTKENNTSLTKKQYSRQKITTLNTKQQGTESNESRIVDDVLSLISESICEIKNEIYIKTKNNVAKSLAKVHNLNNIKIIFGGGGSKPVPYEQEVQYAFHKDNIKLPETLTLPKPSDIEVEDHWMPRLTVAYGLSYNRFDLHKIILPHDIKPLKLTHSKIYYRQIISKDDC